MYDTSLLPEAGRLIKCHRCASGKHFSRGLVRSLLQRERAEQSNDAARTAFQLTSNWLMLCGGPKCKHALRRTKHAMSITGQGRVCVCGVQLHALVVVVSLIDVSAVNNAECCACSIVDTSSNAFVEKQLSVFLEPRLMAA